MELIYDIEHASTIQTVMIHYSDYNTLLRYWIHAWLLSEWDEKQVCRLILICHNWKWWSSLVWVFTVWLCVDENLICACNVGTFNWSSKEDFWKKSCEWRYNQFSIKNAVLVFNKLYVQHYNSTLRMYSTSHVVWLCSLYHFF